MRVQAATPLLCVLLAGCMIGGIRSTTTARTPTEQLLLSTSAERAFDRCDFAHLKGKRVFVDAEFLESLDEGYVESVLRDRVAAAEAELVDTADEATVVVELSCATHGVNDPAWLIGIPMFPGTIPGVADVTAQIPAFTIGFDPQYGWAAFQVWSYDARTGVTLDLAEVWGRAQTGMFSDITPSLVEQVEEALEEEPAEEPADGDGDAPAEPR